MADLWTVIPTGSALLAEKNYIPTYEDDSAQWDRCPICHAPHRSCFYLPGVTDATSPPTG